MLSVQLDGNALPVTAKALAGADITVAAPVAGGLGMSFPLTVSPDAALSAQFTPDFVNLGGNGALKVAISAAIQDHLATTVIDLEEPLTIAPAHTVALEPTLSSSTVCCPPSSRAWLSQCAGPGLRRTWR
ncbi:MAG: hypothetical protein MO852_00245 [Candidatus Devosia euplotis]|nr:hypothetical protein [Candidatus Devosia euplotis]